MIKVYFWRIERKKILWAIMRMALDRITLWRTSGISFWKLLGAGKGETFTPKDADPTRWGLLIVIEPDEISNFEAGPLLRRWRANAISEYAVELSPISVHGEWSRKKPFAHLPHSPASWQGAVVAITRARIKWRKNLIFWRSVPPVTKSLHSSLGLKAAIGIGEAPLGLQGTFSVWESGEAVRNFAYKGEAHKAAIAATHREEWYAEEMFSRFAVTKELGSL